MLGKPNNSTSTPFSRSHSHTHSVFCDDLDLHLPTRGPTVRPFLIYSSIAMHSQICGDLDLAFSKTLNLC
ncbi:hypothetical protein BKA66DRAFT_1349 [Pyrenochaeta sp. MPI-SDFR-AT-0127]|nr:hypothetical protein BKA66DRAFT_1349 [Pyrenochaeta sp. MPI-SDFR-AT-0127]